MTWLFTLLKAMSPTLVEHFIRGLKILFDELAELAAKTPNKVDDWGVDMMRKVFKVDKE